MIAWIRTGLAVMGFGAVVPRILPDLEPRWCVDACAVLFVGTGGLVVFLGVHAYRKLTATMTEAQAGVPWWLAGLLSGALSGCAALLLLLYLLS